MRGVKLKPWGVLAAAVIGLVLVVLLVLVGVVGLPRDDNAGDLLRTEDQIAGPGPDPTSSVISATGSGPTLAAGNSSTTPSSITPSSTTLAKTTLAKTTLSKTTVSKSAATSAGATSSRARDEAGLVIVKPAQLPAEAQSVLKLIAAGGPYPFSRDGIVFENREGILPKKAKGYYHEYTVVTPGEKDRGTRRIVSGSGGERYYTADHYESFVRVLS